MNGFQVCEALKADPALADIPVIFVTAHSDASFEVAGFAIGAVDFIAKPVSASLVQARVQTQLRLKRITNELRRLLVVDALTGVGNRRRFEDVLDREWRRAHCHRCRRQRLRRQAFRRSDVDLRHPAAHPAAGAGPGDATGGARQRPPRRRCRRGPRSTASTATMPVSAWQACRAASDRCR